MNLPDLGLLFADGSRRAIVVELERLGTEIRATDPRWADSADAAATAAYDVDLVGYAAS
jgi:hypothetical protein